jgi:putative membrane protein
MTAERVPSPERVGTIVGAAYGLVALASSATAVVVPTVRDAFDLSLAAGSWVITAFVVALAATWRRFPLSRVSYTVIFLFLCLHTVGAHFTYSLST